MEAVLDLYVESYQPWQPLVCFDERPCQLVAAALDEVFAPQEARRLLQKSEFHYIPKHAAWLNSAEIEFSVRGGQCLKRRIPDQATLEKELAAYSRQRNALKASVQWPFDVLQLWMDFIGLGWRGNYPSNSGA